MNERLFKVLAAGRMPCHGGSGEWPEAGVWREAEGPLVLCENGLHLCREKDLVLWLGPEIWEAEYDGERIDAEDKIVVSKARLVRKVDTWNERTARLFACDCAERVLPIYEKRYPNDKRPRVAIETARRYAEGKATREEIAAARDAAWAAAWASARDAAWDAAWAAARAAARDAAWDAAWAAARDAEWAAARAAARAAAWDAAWASAWDAERKWQTARLIEYLYPEGK
jgi:hypothetical protein